MSSKGIGAAGGVLEGPLYTKGPVYDIRSFSASVGTGANDAPVIAAADAFISAAGGGVLQMSGTYLLSSQINRSANVIWDGLGATRLLQAYWPGTFQGTIQALGTYTDTNITTLTSNATAGDTRIAVASTSGISVGQYLILGSDRAYMDATATHDNVRYRGETIRVSAVVDSTHLDVYGFIQDNYTTSDSASLKGITYLEGVGMRNLTIENTDQGNHNSDFLYLLACRNFVFENVNLKYSDNCGIHLDHCRDGRVTGAHMLDFTDDANNARYGYGVLLNRCTENVTVSESTFNRMRHSVTTNGVDNKRGVPRNCTITGCTAMHMTNAAFDTHNQGAGIQYVGCHAMNCDLSGFQIRSADSKVIGCSASYVNTGIIIGDNGVGVEVRDNILRHIVRKNSAGGYGVQVSGINRVRIVDNTIDGVDRNFIFLQDGTDDAIIKRNECINPGADGTSQSGIKVETGATCTGLQIMDNHLTAFTSGNEEGRTSGTLNHAIDLTTTTTTTTIIGNRATNFAGNMINNGSGTGNVIHSNNPRGSRDRILAVGQGYAIENFRREVAGTNGAPTSGTLYYSLLPVVAGDVITNVYIYLAALATTVTLGKAGLCTTAGVNLAVSADQGTAWVSGTGTAGLQKVPMISPYTVSQDGVIYVQWLILFTGSPTAARGTGNSIGTAANSAARLYGALASQTDITGTQAPTGTGALGWWVAVD